jgi:hypothetical protein
MIFEINFSPTLARWLIFGVGVALTFVAWNTSDRSWAFWRSIHDRHYHINEPVEHFAHKETDLTGGLRRGKYLLIGLALIALALFGGMIADALGIRFVRK